MIVWVGNAPFSGKVSVQRFFGDVSSHFFWVEISLQKLSWIDFVSKICLVDVFVLNVFGRVFFKVLLVDIALHSFLAKMSFGTWV